VRCPRRSNCKNKGTFSGAPEVERRFTSERIVRSFSPRGHREFAGARLDSTRHWQIRAMETLSTHKYS